MEDYVLQQGLLMMAMLVAFILFWILMYMCSSVWSKVLFPMVEGRIAGSDCNNNFMIV